MGVQDTISVFGLGKLGCSMLSCFAYKGWNVIGVDVNQKTVDTLNAGSSPIYEPHVNELLKASVGRFKATMDYSEAVLESSVSFVIVPTPSNEDGRFSTKYLEKVIVEMGKVLRFKDDYHLVVITSTVLPGDVERLKILLEKTSDLKCGVDFGMCYNPDFIALGKVVHDFLNPDMILIGESDEVAGNMLEDIHLRMVNNDPTIHRMNFCNAELAKITLNTYCVMKLNFANVIGEICEHLPGGDARAVLKAVGSDTRVGTKYFKAGLAASGPCFPRDCKAFLKTSEDLDVFDTFAPVIDSINAYHKLPRIISLITKYLGAGKKVAILGSAYKENVQIVEESTSIAIARELVGCGLDVAIYDPAALEMTQQVLADVPNITYAENIRECISEASLCFVATPWEDFRNIPEEGFKESMQNAVVIDAWDMYPDDWKTVQVIKIGKSYE
jgi:UDPglucose 6-dehydrogenase